MPPDMGHKGVVSKNIVEPLNMFPRYCFTRWAQIIEVRIVKVGKIAYRNTLQIANNFLTNDGHVLFSYKGASEI